jgi:hypothetical protein
VESEASRHKACKVLVSSGLFFLFLFRFFEVVLRQTAGLVWTGLYLRVFSGPLCPFFEHIGIGWTLFGKRYMDIYNRKHKFGLFWEQNRPLTVLEVVPEIAIESSVSYFFSRNATSSSCPRRKH